MSSLIPSLGTASPGARTVKRPFRQYFLLTTLPSRPLPSRPLPTPPPSLLLLLRSKYSEVVVYRSDHLSLALDLTRQLKFKNKVFLLEIGEQRALPGHLVLSLQEV